MEANLPYIPIKNDNLQSLNFVYSKNLQAILDEARNQIKNTGGIPHDDFWQAVENADKQNLGK